jgi:hypothetical protein
MKTSKIKLGLFILITLTAVNTLVINVSAQTCKAVANNLFFMEYASGTKVTNVQPGDKVYRLLLVGETPTNFDLVPETYMKDLGTINPANGDVTTAAFRMSFVANMGRSFTHVKLKNKCTGQTSIYKLESKITLSNQ